MSECVCVCVCLCAILLFVFPVHSGTPICVPACETPTGQAQNPTVQYMPVYAGERSVRLFACVVCPRCNARRPIRAGHRLRRMCAPEVLAETTFGANATAASALPGVK